MNTPDIDKQNETRLFADYSRNKHNPTVLDSRFLRIHNFHLLSGMTDDLLIKYTCLLLKQGRNVLFKYIIYSNNIMLSKTIYVKQNIFLTSIFYSLILCTVK